MVAGITGRGPGDRGFDLGLWTSEPVAEVMTRWRAFRAAEPGFGGFVMAHQVHGAGIRWHDGAAGWTVHEGLDGHFTAAPGVMLLVTVADCIPVYLVVPAQGILGLLHAGWRGTAAGILTRAVEHLAARSNVPPADIVMHCGVGICGSCYEVGPEVMTGCGVPAPGPGPWHLDLRARLMEEGRRLGVGQATTSEWCSAHDRPAFYSHRASRGRDGRMVAYVGRPRAVGAD